MTDIAILDFDNLNLFAGGHGPTDGQACVNEAAAWLNGEQWSARPKCVSPIISSFTMRLNDDLDDEGRQRLQRYLPVLRDAEGKFIPGPNGKPQPDLADPRCMLGTNTGLEDEERRRWLIADWMCHVHLPTWLDAAGMTEQAAQVRALPKIESLADWSPHRALFRSIRDAAWERRVEVFAPLRAKVREAVEAEYAKRGLKKPPAAAGVAAADAAADAVAAAVAAADAAADAAGVADAAAAGVAVAAAAGVAAGVADADADAAGAGVAAADAAGAAVAAGVAAGVGAAAGVAAGAAAAPYSSTWQAVYNAVKPIFRKAIDEHATVGPIARSMKDSGFELLDELCAIGR